MKDPDKELAIAETKEKTSQQEYVVTIAGAADKRRQDSELLTDGEAANTDLESLLERSIAD